MPVTDQAEIEAATSQPGTVLKRPVGSKGPFVTDPTSPPGVPNAPRKAHSAKAKNPSTPKAPEPPPADRTDLDNAEATLREIDKARKTEEAKLRDRQAKLDREIETAQSAYVKARKAAMAKVVVARDAYRKAGGQD